MTNRTVSTELTPAQRQAFEEAVKRHGLAFFANADLIWKTLLGPAGDVWQPIETAPKDGTFILVLNGNRRHVAKFDRVENGWICSFSSITKRLVVSPAPTHWMPLPTSPKPTDTAEKEVGDGDDEG